MPFEWATWAQYALALGVVALSLLGRWTLNDALGVSAPFFLTLGALLPLVLLVRPGPFLAAAALGWVGTVYLFVPVQQRFSLTGPAEAAIVLYLAAVLVLAAAAAWLSKHLQDNRENLLKRHLAAQTAFDSSLRDSEARYRLLFDSIDEGFCILEVIFDGEVPIDCRYLEINPVFEQQTGMKDAVGRTFRELVPDIELFWFEIYGRVAVTGEPIRTVDHARSMGRWFDVYAFRIGDANERKVAVLFRDITQRKQAEADRERLLREVQAERSQLAELFEHAPSFMCILRGPEHVFERANANYLRLIGDRDIIGKPAREAITEAERQGFIALLDRVYETGETYLGNDVRLELHDRSGHIHEHWLDFVYQPIRDADGSITGILAQGVDLTEHKRAEMSVRESEERLRNLADNIAQLAWMADGDGWIYWYNRRWFDFTGTTLEEMQGWGWTAVHHPDYVDRVVEKFTACIRSGDRWEDTFPLRGEDGRYRWFLSRAVPIRNDAGEVIRWFGTNTDITEQVELESALKEADRRKDEFIATLAHELRNPLAGIRMATNVIGHPKTDAAQLSEMTSIIERQSSQLVRLIDGLLDVSRITRGKIELHKEPADLGLIIDQAVEGARNLCEQAGIHLHVARPRERLMLYADPFRLTQVVSNLVNNACKFTEAGGDIRIAVERDGPHAVVRVCDTGIGIAPAELPGIFDMFVQADSARQRGGGLGIGLSLAKSIVEMHGGSVEARSHGPGAGSEFIVTLPVTQPWKAVSDPPQGLGRDAESQPPQRARRILAVDDNRDAVNAVAEMLGVNGHHVDVAGSGTEALEKAARFRPELILLDIGLPDIDGYEVARRIRRTPWGDDVLIVALTSWGQEKDRKSALEAGCDAHLTKPADLDALEQLLAEHTPREPAGP